MANVLFPLILCLGLGYLLASVRPELNQAPLITIVLDILMPALVFRSLIEADLAASEAGALAAATILVVAVLLLLSIPAARFCGMRLGVFAPPVLFMNSGFLGIPLMTLIGPTEGAWAVVYDQIQTVLIFTLGLALLSGRVRPGRIASEMGRNIILWAILAATILRVSGIPVPGIVIETSRFIGNGASPVALILVGIAVRRLPFRLSRPVITASVMRLVLGAAVGIILSGALGLEGPARLSVFVLSGLPSAVYSYVLAARYDAAPEYAAAVVVTTTLISIPLILVYTAVL